MDIYTYIASSNPYQARAILHKYGYSVKDARTPTDIGTCLKQLVVYEGEDAFNDILESHPDKNVLLEKYSSKEKSGCEGGKCSCAKCVAKEVSYMNFNGKEENKSGSNVREISIFIIASALLLASAILVKK
jgi:hypothetical protein